MAARRSSGPRSSTPISSPRAESDRKRRITLTERATAVSTIRDLRRAIAAHGRDGKSDSTTTPQPSELGRDIPDAPSNALPATEFATSGGSLEPGRLHGRMESLLHALLGRHADGTAAPRPGTGGGGATGSMEPLLPRHSGLAPRRNLSPTQTLPSGASSDDIDAHIREVRRSTNQSWSNLVKAVLSLQEKPHEPFGTPKVRASARSVARRIGHETGLDLAALEGVGCGKGRKTTLSARGPLTTPS